jgi:type II secretory pathway pseudopilin PulG
MTVDQRNRLISIILAIIIIGLGYWLYRSIIDPYQKVLDREQMTERVRFKMGTVRDALIQFESQTDSFPPSEGGLDTLVQHLKTDSLMKLQADSLFQPMDSTKQFNVDSLIYSPRTNKRFEYSLNDTLSPPIYLLEDPDSEDKIGSLESTTELNSASWE